MKRTDSLARPRLYGPRRATKPTARVILGRPMRLPMRTDPLPTQNPRQIGPGHQLYRPVRGPWLQLLNYHLEWNRVTLPIANLPPV